MTSARGDLPCGLFVYKGRFPIHACMGDVSLYTVTYDEDGKCRIMRRDDMLLIKDKMTRNEIAMALEAARLKGLFGKEVRFPAAGIDGDEPVPEGPEALRAWAGPEVSAAPAGEKPEHPDTLFDLDGRGKKGLETLFTAGRILKDEDHDFLPDAMDVRFVLPEAPSASVVAAACDLACRLGQETTAFCGPVLAEEGYKGNIIEFISEGAPAIRWSEADGAVKITVTGDGKPLEDFASKLCGSFPAINCFDSWTDFLCGLREDFAMLRPDGQLAALKALGEKAKDSTAYVGYGLKEVQKLAFPSVDFKNYKDGIPVYTKTYDLPWEVDEFRDLLEQKLYSVIKAGDVVELYGALSEEQELREQLLEEVLQKVGSLGGFVIGMQLVDAYKQGLSWIREVVLPAVKENGADRVEITFKPFLPEGEKDWRDENGATPNKIRLLENTPDKWFDLPIRYLQELYPVEDMIVEELGVSRENVRFTAYEGEEDVTYLFKAFKDDKVSYSGTYKSVCGERPFMDEYPQLGKVHPSTGYVLAKVNGETVLDARIRTDLETVWDVFQAEVLPDCRRYVEQEYEGRLSVKEPPFFKELRLDITLSETEYRPGSREDMVSSLNALHEDLYFSGTDYFKYLGQQKGDGAFDAPGLILPDIHKGEGRPQFTVTLTRQLRERPSVEKDGRVLREAGERKQTEAWISAVELDENGLCVTVQTEGTAPGLLKAYAELLNAGLLSVKDRFDAPCRIRFADEEGEIFEALCRPALKPEKTKRIEDVDIHEGEVISYETCLRILEELKQIPGLEVFPAAESYEGRTIYGVWLTDPEAPRTTLTRRLSALPSMYVNARHHANEVSSTNEAFMLIRKLLTDAKYKDLTKRMNLVIVPMENVDGTAIHTRLSAEHPNWKLHTARFNAVGKEFALEYFADTRLSTEALAMSRIYRRFVPDVIVDNHGVPSHEWEQQFSGYTSPAYKGFWLPRSLLYGYFWYVKEDPYQKANLPINKKLEDVVADAIGADPEMARWNREWAAQFEKYAHAWMPALFPANYYKEMINYWIPFSWIPRHQYASVCYPWITCAFYTSEVADETAQGKYLDLCARAHLTHDLAIIDTILELEPETEQALEIRADGILAVSRRHRPLSAE